jgi:prepilin-type N-terminal cleavage/methylation domain-containing protein
MFIALVKRARPRAFTLLEITLAVAILGMMSLSIYRFVAANLNVMRISSEDNAAEARYSGFIHLVTAQLEGLPSGVGALSGEPFKFNDRARDEITWICGNGPGVVTRYAAGEFIVNMRLQPVSEKGDRMEIGFMRKPRGTAEGETEGTSWVSLLDDVRSLEIRYFDPMVNVWVDKWTDPSRLPPLVRLVIGRSDREPREAVIAIRRTPLQLAPTQLQALQPAPGQAPSGTQPQLGTQPQPGAQPPLAQPPKRPQ